MAHIIFAKSTGVVGAPFTVRARVTDEDGDPLQQADLTDLAAVVYLKDVRGDSDITPGTQVGSVIALDPSTNVFDTLQQTGWNLQLDPLLSNGGYNIEFIVPGANTEVSMEEELGAAPPVLVVELWLDPSSGDDVPLRVAEHTLVKRYSTNPF